jgi:hypothetical protein
MVYIKQAFTRFDRWALSVMIRNDVGCQARVDFGAQRTKRGRGKEPLEDSAQFHITRRRKYLSAPGGCALLVGQ